MKKAGIAVVLALALVAPVLAAPYVNSAFGYRMEVPAGWLARGDELAKQVLLEHGDMLGKITAAQKPAAVDERIGDKVRLKVEASLAQRVAKFKRVKFVAPAPTGMSGMSWAYAYRTPEGLAQIAVDSLFSYPQNGQHAWIKVQVVAPLTEAKVVGKEMRALIAAFSLAAAPTAVVVVGKSGAADAMVLDETGTLAKVAFETKTVKEELEVYHRSLFKPAVAMEKKLAQLFEDVSTRAERKELTEQGKISAFREIVGRYKSFVSQLEQTAPPSAEMAKAHQGVIVFYRERANLYEQIVEGQAKKDPAMTAKAAEALSKHDFQNTPASQQFAALAQQHQPQLDN